MPITHAFPPDTFTLVPMSQLGREHFAWHPIWSEFYDYDERDEIVAWGVDRQWLERELARVHDGNDHCAYPILRPHPLPARMRLYIKAFFTTAGGAEMEGFVVNEEASVVQLFVGEATFGFTDRGLADLNREDLTNLKKATGREDDPVFPLRYRTDFLDHDGKLIAGEFVPVLPT